MRLGSSSRFIILFITAIMMFSCSSDEVTPSAELTLSNEILVLINEYRASIGKGPLSLESNIIHQAQVHSNDMASGSVSFGHDGFSERVDAIKSVIGGNAWAENVAYGYPDAASVVNGWLNSPGHKRNIEGDYNLTGIGTAKSKDGQLYYTQIFLKK
ncbi:CAP domain-containing protein [Fulvivirgaceae bacterium BMA10]|uniref:CAP domain-containing protein n=1 Tax=Splendidivirga corallicola TaxID=3051826 RepID=A0ABT8KX67_9BACT|nr:CAP domain-containing protein [Fulvivirgaceae bacterium BMA10]